MWNSNLPKANCLYIFASFGKQDITFFRGTDVIEEKLSSQLWDFFIEVKKIEKKFIQNLVKSERGWKPYIRVAFEQANFTITRGRIRLFSASTKERDWRESFEMTN
jgi:hypothetical protein